MIFIQWFNTNISYIYLNQFYFRKNNFKGYLEILKITAKLLGKKSIDFYLQNIGNFTIHSTARIQLEKILEINR